MESQYFNGRHIFQWQLLAEQSSRSGPDRARRAAAVRVRVRACAFVNQRVFVERISFLCGVPHSDA